MKPRRPSRTTYTLQRRRLTLEFVKGRRILNGRNADPLRLNLPDGTRKPCPCPQKPAAKRPQRHDADGHRRIVERLAINGVEFRQAKDDGDEADIKARDGRDRAGERAQVERAFAEIGRVEEADEDGDPVRDVEADGSDGRGGREGDAGAEGWDREEESEERGEADGADGRLEPRAHGGEERRQAAVAGEAEHHARVGREGEEARVPDADDDERHEGDGALVAEDVDEDLRHGLPDVAGDRLVEILDAEEERDEEEEAEEGRDAHGHEDAQRGVPGGVVRLFGQVGRGVVAGDGVLGH